MHVMSPTDYVLNIPVKCWIDPDLIEESAMEQIRNLANLPFAFKHIAIMPDVHSGYGIPIGGVLVTKKVVIPNAVGSDIGCGMCAIKTSLTELDIDTRKILMSKIRTVIPVGHGNWHQDYQDDKWMPEYTDIYEKPVVQQQFQAARKQIGTLGGGNHFIEMQKGSDGFIWIMIHSGSRNLGKKVADFYNMIAKKLNRRWFSTVGENQDLAFLPIETDEAKEYLAEMHYCVDFAFANR